MFANKAQSQPASPRVLPTGPILGRDCTTQSSCLADGRGVLKRSAPALGILNQDYFVVTPVCKRAPQAQAFNDENCPPATTNAPHASLRLPQRANHPNTHCSGKQGTRPASAPIRPNTGVIVVTPMYKKPQAVGKGSGEGGDKDAADAVKALTAALEKSQMSLKEMDDVAALLETDLQAANAAAKVAAFKKEEDDAQALQRQQEAEQKEAALLKKLAVREQRERTLEEEKAALEKRLTEAVNAKIGAAAAKANTAREVKKLKEQLSIRDTQLLAAQAECHNAKTNLSTKEAALAAALQTNEKMAKELKEEQERHAKLKAFAKTQVSKIEALRREKAGAEERAVLAAVEKSESERAAAEQLEDAHRQNEDLAEALQKEQEESAQLKAAQAISVSQTESMRQELVAVEQSTALAIKDNSLGERTAALQLQDAHRELAAAHQEVEDLEAAREDAEHQAASATQQAAAERVQCRWVRVRIGEACDRAEAAEAALSAANTDIQLARAEAGAAQERIRSLVADVSAKENTIVDLQGRFMDASAADSPFTSQAPHDQAQPATPEASTQPASVPDAIPSAPATVAVTTDDTTTAISTSDSAPSAPATPEEDTTSAASGVPRSSPADASLGQPRGPALPRLPEEAPTRSKAAQPYGLARKIASVSRRLLSIMAADVNNWQTIVQA